MIRRREGLPNSAHFESGLAGDVLIDDPTASDAACGNAFAIESYRATGSGGGELDLGENAGWEPDIQLERGSPFP